MGKRERRQVAYAVVELEDARDELAASGQDVSSALKRIEDAVERLDRVSLMTPRLTRVGSGRIPEGLGADGP